jgi:hypothetical protein
MKLEFSQQILEKKHQYQFHENPFIVPRGRTGGAMLLIVFFLQFCETA